MRNDQIKQPEFMQQRFAAVESLTTQESVSILTHTSWNEFVQFMRRTLPPQESWALTDVQLNELHKVIYERLQSKAGQA